jgi:hypothetical protein
MEIMYLTERRRLVRLWNQLSGNGQRGSGLMSSPKGCLLQSGVFRFFSLWNVFRELWASHGQLGGNASRLMPRNGLARGHFPCTHLILDLCCDADFPLLIAALASDHFRVADHPGAIGLPTQL